MLPVCGAVAHAFLPGQACALLARAIVLPHGGCERVLLSVCTSAHVHRPSEALVLRDLVAVQPLCVYVSALCSCRAGDPASALLCVRAVLCAVPAAGGDPQVPTRFGLPQQFIASDQRNDACLTLQRAVRGTGLAKPWTRLFIRSSSIGQCVCLKRTLIHLLQL